MRRHELSDAQWKRSEDMFPPDGTKGGQWKDHRQILNGMFWRLQTGAPWRDLPERYGPWQTVYDRFNRYSKNGIFDQIVERLQCQLDAQGRIDWDLWCVDGSVIRASRAAAGARKKRRCMNLPIMP
jgi:transposase